MPFKWALKTGSETSPTFQGVTFFGPYMVVDTNKGISPGQRVTWWLSAPFRFTCSSRVSVKSKRLCGWVTSYSLATLDAEPHLGLSEKKKKKKKKTPSGREGHPKPYYENALRLRRAGNP